MLLGDARRVDPVRIGSKLLQSRPEFRTAGAELLVSYLLPVFHYDPAALLLDPHAKLPDREERFRDVRRRFREAPDKAAFLHEATAPVHELQHFLSLITTNVGFRLVYNNIVGLHCFATWLRYYMHGMQAEDFATERLTAWGEYLGWRRLAEQFYFAVVWPEQRVPLSSDLAMFQNQPCLDSHDCFWVLVHNQVTNARELWPFSALPFFEAAAILRQAVVVRELFGNGALQTWYWSEYCPNDPLYVLVANAISTTEASRPRTRMPGGHQIGNAVSYVLNGPRESDWSDYHPSLRFKRFLFADPLERFLEEEYAEWDCTEQWRLCRKLDPVGRPASPLGGSLFKLGWLEEFEVAITRRRKEVLAILERAPAFFSDPCAADALKDRGLLQPPPFAGVRVGNGYELARTILGDQKEQGIWLVAMMILAMEPHATAISEGRADESVCLFRQPLFRGRRLSCPDEEPGCGTVGMLRSCSGKDCVFTWLRDTMRRGPAADTSVPRTYPALGGSGHLGPV
ncbi:MAG: hypothetical protein AB2L07_15660 [Thermoanaerobaculaceae bacterium]